MRARVRSSTVVSGARRSSSWTRSASADSAGRVSTAARRAAKPAITTIPPGAAGRRRHRDPVDRGEHVDRLGSRLGGRGAPRDQALRAGEPAHRPRHHGLGHPAGPQLPVDGRARELDLRVRGLRHREQVGRPERRQVALHHHVAELARELGAAQQRVGVVDRAGLLPRARHQLLLALLHDARAGRGGDAQPRVQVELRAARPAGRRRAAAHWRRPAAARRPAARGRPGALP